MKRVRLSLGLGVLLAALSAGAVPAHAAAPTLLSQNKPVTASSEGGSGYVAEYAVDGSTSTRWASVRDSDPQWIYVDLGATAQISEVKLTWDLSCATSYQVQTSGDHSSWTTIYSTTKGDGGTDDLSVTGSGRYVRVNGTKRCRDTSSYGYSLQEFQVYGTSGADTTAPTTPANLRSTATTSDSVSLAWDASTDNVGVAAYDIYNDGNKISEAAGTATTKTITGLTPKTEYRLTVFARDAAGNVSASSNSVTVTTDPTSDTEPPSAPGNLRSTGVTSSTASLAWDASTDNVGVTGYDVYSGGTAIVTGVTGTTTTISGLAADTSYTFTVKAKDAGNNVSAASNAVTVKTSAGSGGGGVPSGIKTISSGWSIPWGMSWLPDGSALISERDSFALYELKPDGTKTKVGTVPNVVTTDGEGGLLGVAVSPHWSTDHFVYIMHTASEGNRIVRMTYDGSSLGGYKILVQGIKKNRYHNGGRLKFGPDGYLYATTGEAQTPDLAQDKSSLNGKILRMTTDGKPAPGNPFGTLVYSYGHRNPQGITWDPQGRLWEAEFGNSKYDEVNLIEPGKDYGWPTCEGKCGTAGMTNPKVQWPVAQASPSDITYADGSLYVAALRGQRLWRVPVSGTTTGTPVNYYVNTYGRLRTVETVPGGNALWLSTTNCDNNGNQPDGSDKVFRVDLK
jgi:glucose/arabinose dehydrogenase